MLIEINYKALHFDNHQGGSGNPFDGRLLREVDGNIALEDMPMYARRQLERESEKNNTLMGNFRLVNIVIDSE